MNKKDLKIIYMGTPDFAVAPLRALVEGGYNVVGVVTVPDRPSGRGLQLRASAVKEYALKVNAERKDADNTLKILQPQRLKDEAWLNELRSIDADLFIVVAFRMLPKVVWTMPKQGTFNLHASLLPDYRGAAPINWAIINGEKRTGVTTFFIDEKIDCGEIIDNSSVEILTTDNAGTLHDKLMTEGSLLVIRTVDAIISETIRSRPQPEVSQVKDAPKIFKDDCKIDWTQDCEDIHNKIRGLSPYPAAWTELTPQLTAKILDSGFERVEGFTTDVGLIDSDGSNYLKISAKNGWVSINRIHCAGKKAMNIKDFLRGYKIIEL